MQCRPPGGRKEGSTKQDLQNNVPSRDVPMVVCRKHPALGAGLCLLSKLEVDMNPALRIYCPYLPLPLEATSQNLYSKPRQGGVPGHSQWKGCLANGMHFPMERKPLLKGIWIPICYKNPLPTGLSALTIGGRVSAPKVLFCIVNSSTHWSNKQEKKNGHSCAWCSGTYLPASLQVCGASLPATV